MTKVSVAILSYNEAKSLPEVVKKLSEGFAAFFDVSLKVLVVNNGSKDETPAVIDALEQQYNFVSHLNIQQNIGYGWGVSQGLSKLNGDLVGFMWGDNQFDPVVVAKMVKIFKENEQVQFVKTFRSRRYDGQYRLIISRIYQLLFKVLYGGYTKDINSGPKFFRYDLLRKIEPLQSKDWFIDAEIMIKVAKTLKPSQVIEIPIEFFPRKFGKSNVKFSDCFKFTYNLFKYKFLKF